MCVCVCVCVCVCARRVDSMMLVSEGFNVVSTDASDKMLKYALKERWNRRKDPAFDQWGNLSYDLYDHISSVMHDSTQKPHLDAASQQEKC